MATKLFLRNTQTNGIGSTYFDMLIDAGAGATTAVTTAVASGTEIQWTQTAGGTLIQWISGRVPSGGFTLTAGSFSGWYLESAMGVNAGQRIRIFRRDTGGGETELGGGPFDDNAEFALAIAEEAFPWDCTDTAFAEDERILVKLYMENIGTMGDGTVTLTYNAADAAEGDSFFSITENVTFKAEDAATQSTPGNWFPGSNLRMPGIWMPGDSLSF